MPDDKTAAPAPTELEVYAIKGPLAGRRVVLPADQVDAATADNGWAVKIEPGAQLLPDPGAPYDTAWVIPGYSQSDLEPFAAKPTDTAKATAKAPAEKPVAEPAGSSSASKTSSSQPAAPSATEPDAASPNGGGSTPSGTKTTTTKTSSK